MILIQKIILFYTFKNFKQKNIEEISYDKIQNILLKIFIYLLIKKPLFLVFGVTFYKWHNKIKKTLI